MREFLSHCFFPRESNNYRAKILHHTSIIYLILTLLALTVVFPIVKKDYPSVLGITTNITTQQLLILTNSEREKIGVKPLKLDDRLNTAALKKGEDMFAKNYWAHNSPDGTTPWVFIRNEDYKYVYAGENLARGFNSPEDLVNAWMASSDHRANLLSSSFEDVGFAVLTGKLNGEETVLVVQEFGGQNVAIAQQNQKSQTNSLVKETQSLAAFSFPTPAPLIDSKNISGSISLAIIFLFMVVLTLDVIIMRNKKIVRVRGHNLDHIMFLLLITFLVLIIGRGVIL